MWGKESETETEAEEEEAGRKEGVIQRGTTEATIRDSENKKRVVIFKERGRERDR